MIINEEYNIDDKCKVKEETIQDYIDSVIKPLDVGNNSYFHIMLPFKNVSDRWDEFSFNEIWYLEDVSVGKTWYLMPVDLKYIYMYTCEEFYLILKEYKKKYEKKRDKFQTLLIKTSLLEKDDVTEKIKLFLYEVFEKYYKYDMTGVSINRLDDKEYALHENYGFEIVNLNEHPKPIKCNVLIKWLGDCTSEFKISVKSSDSKTIFKATFDWSGLRDNEYKIAIYYKEKILKENDDNVQ